MTKKKIQEEINLILKEKNLSVWSDTDIYFEGKALGKKVSKICSENQINNLIDEDFEESSEMLIEKSESKKIKGNLLIVYSKFSASSDPADLFNYEEKVRNDFLMYDRFFKVHFYNVFLNEDIDDFLKSLNSKPFLCFFLKNNSFSDIKDLIKPLIENNGYLYSEKDFESEKIKHFENGRRAFLICKKQKILN